MKKCKKIQSLKKEEDYEINKKIIKGYDVSEAEISYLASNSSYSVYQKITPEKVTNHIPENYFIGSKKILFYLLNWYYLHIK